MEQYKEYFAFISYKREDEDWAKWLAHELEHYHLPLTLNGRDDLPKDLRPIFRDIDELSVGNLPQQINQALENSKNLIVICSPNVAKHSEWVDKEIEAFIKRGKIDRIFPFIIDGVPFAKNGEEECFPKALRNLPQKDEKIAANVSEYKDKPQRLCKDCPLPKESESHIKQGNINDKGRDAAVVKIVAGMLGLNFDTLWQRYEKEKAEEEQRIKEQRDNLLRVQSRFLAEKANALLEGGDSYTARLIALEALPSNITEPDKPYTIEAEVALRRCSVCNCTILKGHTDKVYMACMSPDGKLIASASRDDTIKIWDAERGREIHCIKPFGYVERIRHISFSADSKMIIYVIKGSVRVCDISGYHLISISENCRSAYFSADGKNVLGAGDNIKIFNIDVRDDKLSSLHKEDALLTFDSSANCNFASYSNDGNYVVSSSYEYGGCSIWDSKSGEYLYGLEIENENDYVAERSFFSPDGTRVISAPGDQVMIWDTKKRKIIHCIDPHPGIKIYNAIFSPDGKSFVTASADSTVKVWDAEKGGELKRWHHDDIVYYAEFCNDGQSVISASSDKTIRIWDFKKKYHEICLISATL